MSFVARRKDFLKRHVWHCLAEFLDLGEHVLDLGLPRVCLGDDPGNRFSVPGDDKAAAPSGN
jgi:hypothetical protein